MTSPLIYIFYFFFYFFCLCLKRMPKRPSIIQVKDSQSVQDAVTSNPVSAVEVLTALKDKSPASAKSVMPKTPISKSVKYDREKFSKALIIHCRANKFRIPDSEFLDYLDMQANGEIPEYDDSLFAEDENLTQEVDSDEDQ
nr:MAG: hypothetical protein [Cressdnaviricota sp.]